MKTALFALLLLALFAATMPTQHSTEAQQKPPAVASATNSAAHTDDAQQLRADVQRLQVLVTQMRNNLAFVQTSQTPLKHQFELEADAWQVIIDDMNRRLKRMEDHAVHTGPQG